MTRKIDIWFKEHVTVRVQGTGTTDDEEHMLLDWIHEINEREKQKEGNNGNSD